MKLFSQKHFKKCIDSIVFSAWVIWFTLWFFYVIFLQLETSLTIHCNCMENVFWKSIKKTGKVQELSRSAKNIGYRPCWNQAQLAGTLAKELSMVALTCMCAQWGKHDPEKARKAEGTFDRKWDILYTISLISSDSRWGLIYTTKQHIFIYCNLDVHYSLC